MESHCKWKSDKSHSAIYFKVKHLLITNIQGMFRDFEITMDCPKGKFDKAEINCFIDASSIFTNDEIRDRHLQSGEFFDVENFPTIEIQGKLHELDAKNYHLKGLLKIRDIERPILWMAEYDGAAKNENAQELAGFSIYGKLSRADWELKWNNVLPGGTVLLGDEVVLTADLQMRKTAKA